MVTRLKPQRVKSSNSPQVGQNLGYEDSNNFKWQDTGTGVGDMNYADFEWQTLTGNAITIEDISNNITPSSDFTVSAGTVKPGIEYVLRVNTGNTPYTMTLGTGVTNPNSYKTELKPNTVNQFKFIATSTNQLELEGVDSATVSEINWGEIDGTLSNQTDLQNALNTKADNADVNTKTFYLSSTSDLTNAQAAYDWWKSGKEAIIYYNNRTYIFERQTTASFDSPSYSGPILSFNYTRGPVLPYDSRLDTASPLSAAGATLYLGYSNDVVSIIIDSGVDYSSILPCDSTTPIVYSPYYNWDPATKKYVDDQVSAATSGAVSDTAYGSSWDGVTGIAPSKNAVYDKISTIDTAISGINSKIPSEASASNQLADKDFVGDSINSVTAFYITKNANGDQFATYAELAAATTFYSGGVVRVPTKNDYTIVLSDETHDNATTRYIYNSGWEYQYTVNETALTQAQLNAINSGITAAKVTQYDGYATSKQDVLSAGTGISISSNTVTNTLPFNGTSGGVKVFDLPSNGGSLSSSLEWQIAGGQVVYRDNVSDSENLFYVQEWDLNTREIIATSISNGMIIQSDITYNASGTVTSRSETTTTIPADLATITSAQIKTGTATTKSAVTAAALAGAVPVLSTQANNLLTSGMKIWVGTQANYEALDSYDNSTAYLTI